MTLKPQCDCSTCDACGNAPGRSGYCLNCEVTDSGSEGSHAQHTTETKYYVTAIADEDGHECDSCGVIPEWFTGWYGLVGEDEGGFIAYFSTLEAANAAAIAAERK